MVALKANYEIALNQIPQLLKQLAAYETYVETLVHSRGISIADASVLHEQLTTKRRAIEKELEKQQEQKRIAQDQIAKANREIERNREWDKQQQGFLRHLLGGYHQSHEAAARIAIQQNVIQESQNYLLQAQKPPAQPLTKDENDFLWAFDMANAVRNSIRHHESAKSKYLRPREAEEKKKAKDRLKNALLAAFLNRTRDLADEIKRELFHQIAKCPTCPYCGGEYGDEPHADHIWPVSKGGLSVRENMVLICGECNLRKSSRTLRVFIVECEMDRSLIETNLESLGKTF